jgi:uncharacterized phiE125 gp8 family phage protein
MGMSPGMGLKLVTAPTWEPVLVSDLANHSRIQGNNDTTNGVVQAMILTAREYVETATRRKIAQQQWLLTVDEFPGRQVDDYRPPTWRYGIFRMPFPPLISVDQIQYVDPTQQTQPFTLTTLDPSKYMVDTNTEPGRVAPAPYNVWPATNPLAFQAVQVTFTCGYANVGLVPPGIIHAIKLLAAHFYEHREATREQAISAIPLGLAALISSQSCHEYD